MRKITKSLLMAAVFLFPWIEATPQKSSMPSVRDFPDGIWEASNGDGGAVGINLWQMSSSIGHGGPLVIDNAASGSVLEIGVYERIGEVVHCGEENFFDTGWRHQEPGFRSEFTDHLLTVSYPRFAGEVAIDIELTWNQRADVWEGRFHRGSFDRQITLRRRIARSNHGQSPCFGRGIMPPIRVARQF